MDMYFVWSKEQQPKRQSSETAQSDRFTDGEESGAVRDRRKLIASTWRAFGFGAWVGCWILAVVSLKAEYAVAQSDDRKQPGPPAPSAKETLLDWQQTIQTLLPKLEAATICLEAGGGSGSGVIVNKDGLILTAAHVVDNAPPDGMRVRFADGRTRTCRILGIYKPADAAMAQIIEPGPYDFVDMAPAGSIYTGQTVLATGHPSGYDPQRGIPLRLGHICLMKKNLYGCDTALIGGDSGGPSFNLIGQVIGIHSNIASELSANNDVQIDVYHEHWDSLLSGEIRGGKLFAEENAPDNNESQCSW